MNGEDDSATPQKPAGSRLRQVRLFLWLLVALSLIGMGAILLLRRDALSAAPAQQAAAQPAFGGPFALTGADGNGFSSSRLAGKPYAIFFGFTRCGDVCP